MQFLPMSSLPPFVLYRCCFTPACLVFRPFAFQIKLPSHNFDTLGGETGNDKNRPSMAARVQPITQQIGHSYTWHCWQCLIQIRETVISLDKTQPKVISSRSVQAISAILQTVNHVTLRESMPTTFYNGDSIARMFNTALSSHDVCDAGYGDGCGDVCNCQAIFCFFLSTALLLLYTFCPST